MSTIKFDFRHNYRRGERREAASAAYQWDLGHEAEIYVPMTATYEVHYTRPGWSETEDYAVESCTAVADGGYKLIAHIPNKYFETSGELGLYIVGSADDHVITTYEGYITILGRKEPEDYTDDDPENGAETIIEKAREYANQSEAWADGEIEGEAVSSDAPQYHNNSEYYAGQASASATTAEGHAEQAEAWADGEINGTPVSSDAPQYHNNAAYHAGLAAGSATTAEGHAEQAEAWADGEIDGTPVGSSAPQYHNNAAYYAGQASGSATAASNSANAASASELNAEAWAQGTKNGVPVTSSDPQYHKSAQYVADNLSADIAGLQAQIDRILTEIGIAVEADHTSMTAAHSAGEYVYSEGHLYRLLKNLAVGAAIVSGTGTSWDSAEEVTINSDLATERLWFKSAPVTATTGTIVDITDARITKQHVLAEIHWGDSSYITALTDWSTDTAGHFIITGTASAATTVTVLLVRAVTKDLSS